LSTKKEKIVNFPAAVADEQSMAKTAFCYIGAGARGSIQAGITVGLARQGIVPDLVTGISSGSACAAIYGYEGAQGLADYWSDIRNILTVFGFNWGFLWKRGIFNQKPMERTIAKMIKKKPICEAIVARLHIGTSKLEYVSNMEVEPEVFAEAALGSVAITCLVEDRKGWVDAGSRELAPLQTCIDAGADNIYIINGATFDQPEWEIPRNRIGAFAMMGFRALDINLNEIMRRDLGKLLRRNMIASAPTVNVYLVEPNATLFNPILFRRCKEGVKYGLSNYTIHDAQQIQTKYFA